MGFCINFCRMRKIYIHLYGLCKWETAAGFPGHCQLKKSQPRSMLSLGDDVRFETRLRLCLISKILNVFWKFCCAMLAILSFLCLWVDSVPQTDLLGVCIHTFSSPGIFGSQTFPDLPTPCQNEMLGRKRGVWYESSQFKPLKGTIFVWVHSKGGFPLPQHCRHPCLWCGSCSAQLCSACVRDRAAGESCNL